MPSRYLRRIYAIILYVVGFRSVETEHLTCACRQIKFEPAFMVGCIERIGLGEMMYTLINIAEASEILVVG